MDRARGPTEWDAETYDAVSDPQFSWGIEVLERLELSGDEIGARRRLRLGPSHRRAGEAPPRRPRDRGRRLRGDDRQGAGAARDGADYIVADLSELELAEPVDLIFSTATFHWILDHDRLFARLRAGAAAGWPPGRAVRRRRQRRRARAGDRRGRGQARVRPALRGRRRVWNFAAPEETEERLRAGRLRRRPLLAGAEAGQPPEPARVHLDRHPRAAARPAPGGAARPLRRSRPRRVDEPAGARLRAAQHRGVGSADA